MHFIADKGDPDWPQVKGYERIGRRGELARGPGLLEVAVHRVPLRRPSGVAAAFPLFIVKNYEVGLTGGWLVNRVYFETDRWARGRCSTPRGLQLDRELLLRRAGMGGRPPIRPTSTTCKVAYFVGEIGMKFRVNMVHTPAKFLARITDFWGMRTGVKATGGFDIKQLSYVIEFGAGTF